MLGVSWGLGRECRFGRFCLALLLALTAAVDVTMPWCGSDIQSGLIGNNIVGEAQDFFSAAFVIYFNPEGTARGVVKKLSIMVTDFGRWVIGNDRICVQWLKWDGNDRLCRTTATRNGEILIFDADGVVPSRQSIRKGNRHKL